MLLIWLSFLGRGGRARSQRHHPRLGSQEGTQMVVARGGRNNQRKTKGGHDTAMRSGPLQHDCKNGLGCGIIQPTQGSVADLGPMADKLRGNRKHGPTDHIESRLSDERLWTAGIGTAISSSPLGSQPLAPCGRRSSVLIQNCDYSTEARSGVGKWKRLPFRRHPEVWECYLAPCTTVHLPSIESPG